MHFTQSTRSLTLAATPLIVLGSVILGGCAVGRAQPHERIGALPYPGLTSLFHAADSSDLGNHHYASWSARPFDIEGDRGIIYTDRAGFVDVAHIRLAADWAWYTRMRIADARARVAASAPGSPVPPIMFPFEGATVTVQAPEDPADDAAVAARVSCALMTWHEIATWYGYSMMPFISERRSAFTYDDTVSHFIGVNAAYEVINAGATEDTYDMMMTGELTSRLEVLKPRPPTGTIQACIEARGRWWEGRSPRVRDVAIHLDGSEKHGLVLGEHGIPGLGSGALTLPGSNIPDGWIEIDASNVTRDRVRAVLGTTRINGTTDLCRLVDDVAKDMERGWRTIVFRESDEIAMEHAIQNARVEESTNDPAASGVGKDTPGTTTDHASVPVRIMRAEWHR